MKPAMMLALLQTGYTTIVVQFNDGTNRPYTYKAHEDMSLEAGDHVVVDTPRNGLCVAEVVEVHDKPQIDLDSGITYKWIVDKVDTGPYKAQLEAEQRFHESLVQVERERQRQELLDAYHARLPEGTKARELFDATMKSVGAEKADV